MTFFAKHKTIRVFFDFQELYSLTTLQIFACYCVVFLKKFVPLQKLSVIS